jgi:hypothetical protein
MMLTSLRIDDDLYRIAKASAASEGVTITKYLDQALRLRLVYDANATVQKTTHASKPISLPTCPVALKMNDLSMADFNAAEDLHDKEEAARFLSLAPSVQTASSHA